MIRHRKWGLNFNKWNIAEKFLYIWFVRKADLRSYFSDIFIHEVILLVPSCVMKKLIVQQLFVILLSSLNHIKFIDHIQDIDIHFLLLMTFKMKKKSLQGLHLDSFNNGLKSRSPFITECDICNTNLVDLSVKRSSFLQ